LPYCKDSGSKFSENCLFDPRASRLEYGYFGYDNRPINLCERHVLCYYDEVTGAIAHEGCPTENLKQIALLDVSDRTFPTEVFVTDAEFVWRTVLHGTKFGDSFDVPFFIYSVEEGEFVGRSRKKKQFNSYCYLHGN